MWFIDAGGERGPDELPGAHSATGRSRSTIIERASKSSWPAPGIGRHAGRHGPRPDADRRLNHFTATAGPEIFRGHRLPRGPEWRSALRRTGGPADPPREDRQDRRADAAAQRVSRIRVHPEHRPAVPSGQHAGPAPDGTHLHRGHVPRHHPGVELDAARARTSARKIEQYQLDKVIDARPDLAPALRRRFRTVPATAASPAQPGGPGDRARPDAAADVRRDGRRSWSRTSRHPNGWWRDTAQRLLVLQQDKSVVPALQAMVRTSDNLAGALPRDLDARGPRRARRGARAPADEGRRTRGCASRPSAPARRSTRPATGRSRPTTARARRTPTPTSSIQAMLTLNVLKVPDAAAAIRAALETNTARGVKEIGKLPGRRRRRRRGGRGGASARADQQAAARARQHDLQRAVLHVPRRRRPRHAARGAAAGTMRAPPLDGSPRVTGHRDYVIKALLHGLTGPLDGQTYTEVMIPMGAQKDEWIADIASYVRNSFGNRAPSSPPPTSRACGGQRHAQDELDIHRAGWRRCRRLLEPQPTWKVTASHNAATAGRVLPTSLVQGTWTTGEPQAPGMWFQIELPRAGRRSPRFSSMRRRSTPAAVADGAAAGCRGAGAAAPPPVLWVSPRLQGRGLPGRPRVDDGGPGRGQRADDDGRRCPRRARSSSASRRRRHCRTRRPGPCSGVRLYRAPASSR